MKQCTHCHRLAADILPTCRICGGSHFDDIGDELPFGPEYDHSDLFEKVVSRHVDDPVLRNLYRWQWKNACCLHPTPQPPGENRTDDSQGLQYEEE